jgi:hypothetical protein
LFAALCGWDIPLKKSPLAAFRFRALGVFVDLSPLPAAAATIVVCERRVEALLTLLLKVITTGSLTSGHAASLVGKLLFASVAFAGFFGKSMIKAIRRRCYERRANLNPQLLSSLHWWFRQLKLAPPRPIPWCMQGRRVVVTYSDGEGADAGVGVAIWASCLGRAQAGRLEVPNCVRAAWSSSCSREPFYDIQEIEGIGPLIALTTWPDVLRDAMWLHFIDNNGALSSLVRGGSSVLGTDTIVGMTWHSAAKLNACPWFDRVDTKSNPVDGLSRGDLSGDWDLVELKFPGASLSSELRKARRLAPS